METPAQRSRGRFLIAVLAVVAGGAALSGVGASVPGARGASSRALSPAAQLPSVVIVTPTDLQNPIPTGFLGLSIEYWAVEAYAGKDPGAVNPVLVQLIRNLTPGQTGVLRIGGVTTDHTWWPVAGVHRSGGLTYQLDQRRLEVIKALADQINARLILGINFEADSSRLAGAEARAMLDTIGRSRIAAFELGNEPELYPNPNFGWYRRGGRNVTGRPRGYDMAAFTRDAGRIAAHLPDIPLADPATGGSQWLSHLSAFVAGEPRLGTVTIHRYPFEACDLTPASPVFPTIGRLLSSDASVGQAAAVGPYLSVAHGRGLPLRIDEMNTVACGNPPGIADTSAMALWAIDALFADAQAGVDGVNIHTWPGAVYNLFTFRRLGSGWQGSVEPEYYGLLMFAQGAPAGSDLVATSSSSDAIRAWATRGADGKIRVTLINDDASAAHAVALRVGSATATATIERLLAPGPAATGGVTLAGQSLAETTTGLLGGPALTAGVVPVAGVYSVFLPAASAALLTIG